MRLAHPGVRGIVGDLHVLAPECLQCLAHEPGERLGIDAAAVINDPVDLPLVCRLHQMRDEIVIVRVADHAGEHPAAEARIRVRL